MTYTARFDVICCEPDGQYNRYERSGFLQCDDFTDAMQKIEDFYGEEMESCHIQLFEYTFIEMTKEQANEITKQNFL